MNGDDVGLEIRCSTEGGGALLHLAGELDLRSAPHLRAAIVDVLGEAPVATPRTLVVDLSRLTYADSAGLSMLVAAYKRAASQGGSVRLRSPRPTLRRLLRVSGLDTIFDIEEPTGPEGGPAG